MRGERGETRNENEKREAKLRSRNIKQYKRNTGLSRVVFVNQKDDHLGYGDHLGLLPNVRFKKYLCFMDMGP